MPYAGHKWGSASLGTGAGEISWSFTDFVFPDAAYSFFQTTGTFRAVIERAFDAWEAVANIDFTEVSDAFENDIRIGLGTLDGNAGPVAGECTTTFTGDGVIVKAEIAMDKDEPWIVQGDDLVLADGIGSFLAVANHEIGHALGLNHEDSVPSIMSTFTSADVLSLTAADIALIQSIYGVGGGDGNVAPIIGQGSDLAVRLSENSRLVTQLTGSDSDGDTLSWSIAGGADAARFSIDTATGSLQFRTAPDFEAPADVGGNNVYDVVVQLSDGSASDTINLAVTVADVAGLRLSGTAGRDRLTGGGENDSLSGAAGNDILRGNAGADRLIGGKGADQLFAGGDEVTDRFIFEKGDSGKTTSTRDKIFNFDRDTDGRPGRHGAGSDLIDLSRIDADTARGDQALRFVSAFTKAAEGKADGQLKVKDLGANLLVEIDVNGDNRSDMAFEVMAVARLTADDFIL